MFVGLSAVFFFVSWIGETFLELDPGLALIGYLAAYFFGGFEVARSAIPALAKGKFDTDLLMLSAAMGAGALGRWAEGAFLLFLFSLGHAGEQYAMDRARSAIDGLAQLMPDTALVITDQGLQERPVDGLSLGELVLVRPGDRVPVDGSIVSGISSLDESPITGESVPVPKAEGSEVFAGSVNLDAALDVRVEKLAENTLLRRVMEMVAEAQARRSPSQNFAQRFTARFVPAVLILTIVTAVVPPFVSAMTFEQSVYRALLLLVAASPCALALGTPAAVLAAIGRAARNGVLIKGGGHLEALGKVRVMAFDKTGTLTQGRFSVTDAVVAEGVSEGELWRVAAAVEQSSNHPLAQAVLAEAQRRGLPLEQVEASLNVPGSGIEAELDGQPALVGSLKLFQGERASPLAPTVPEELKAQVARLEQRGRTVMLVSLGDRMLGVMALADTPRSTAKAALARLKELGVQRHVMLTGDNALVAANVGEELGLDEVRASLLPAQKVEAIEGLQATYGTLAMTGDGVNDAPALATADIGIAMAGVGTAVALETADVALMADDLSKLPFAVGLSRLCHSIIVQNIAIALGVIVMLVITSVLGIMELGLAVVFHEGSTVLVVLNALRLLNYRLPES